MVAVTGAVRVDPRYTTRNYHPGYRSCPNSLDLSGSIASFAPPVLYWSFGSGVPYYGWSRRRYSYDRALRSTPPPFYPITEPWQAITREPANLDCLTSASTLWGRGC
jgi:hypothetical protein